MIFAIVTLSMFPVNSNPRFLLKAPSTTLIVFHLILDFSFEHLLDAESPVGLHPYHPASHKSVRSEETYPASNQHEPNAIAFIAGLHSPIATAANFPLSGNSDEREPSRRLI
ncbi:MAG: hypothetical protein ACLQE9_19060 [Roseiarcus sp.]